jgi:hypothetical protein
MTRYEFERLLNIYGLARLWRSDAIAARIAELEDAPAIWEKASIAELCERREEQNKRIIDLERQTAILKKGYEYALKFLDILAGDILELERKAK